MNVIKCDRCQRYNNPKSVSLYDRTIKPGIQARLWNCSHCNTENTVIIMDKTSRRMMQDNKEDREKVGKINNNPPNSEAQSDSALKKSNTLWEQIEKRTAELDDRSRKLMSEHGSKA